MYITLDIATIGDLRRKIHPNILKYLTPDPDHLQGYSHEKDHMETPGDLDDMVLIIEAQDINRRKGPFMDTSPLEEAQAVMNFLIYAQAAGFKTPHQLREACPKIDRWAGDYHHLFKTFTVWAWG